MHAPTGSYRAFRACLRWEFGFTCAFCLVHEADLVEHGAQGTGLSWIEHHVRRTEDPSQADVYANCFYSCRFCNQARDGRPNIDRAGRRLLEPCSASWRERFSTTADHRLDPLGDDAAYTEAAYDLNEPRKLTMKQNRARAIDESRRRLAEAPDLIDRLLAVAESAPSEQCGAILQAARELQRDVASARDVLLRYAAVPRDADPSCACAIAGQIDLPPHLAEQCGSVDL